MNVNKFKKIMQDLSTLLTIIGVLWLVAVVVILVLFIGKSDKLTFNSLPITFLYSFSWEREEMAESTKELAMTMSYVPMMFMYAYIFLKGSQFFGSLSKGKTPFSSSNYQLLKKIGVVLMLFSFLQPFVYSLIATLNMPNGGCFSFGLDKDIIIGLIIYCTAEVIRYGITLQDLSDETV